MSVITNVFPDYFSQDAIDKIFKNGKEENIEVYRVCKYGRDITIGFLNYYEEVIQGLKMVRNRQATLEKYSKNIDSLSVSCYYLLDDIIYYYSVTLKDSYPERILLKGITSNVCGLSQRTSERKEKNDSHVDWWLYKDVKPWTFFKEEKI